MLEKKKQWKRKSAFNGFINILDKAQETMSLKIYQYKLLKLKYKEEMMQQIEQKHKNSGYGTMTKGET